MIIKERKVGDINPFRYEYIPETEEEMSDLAIDRLCNLLRLPPRGTLFVEKDILDKAIERGDIIRNNIILIDADAAEIDSVFDDNTLEYCKPEWGMELFKKSSGYEHVFLIINIDGLLNDGMFHNERRLRWFICLAKDRVCGSWGNLPSNVRVVTTGTSYDVLNQNSNKTARELLGLCLRVVKRKFA